MVVATDGRLGNGVDGVQRGDTLGLCKRHGFLLFDLTFKHTNRTMDEGLSVGNDERNLQQSFLDMFL